MPIKISIIIVNYQSKGFVRECIKNFKRHPTTVPFEIIVVDNGGEPGLQELLESRFPDVVYVKLLKNFGLSAGNNTGARIAQGSYLLFCNPDITALDQSLDTLYHYMEANPAVGMAGPQLLYPDRSIQQSTYRFYTLLTPLFRRTILGRRLAAGQRHLREFLMHSADLSKPLDVELLMGACLFVRRAALEKVGFMDERFFLYFEDTDWCTRFWDSGFRIAYVPHAQVVHLHERASARRMGLFSLLGKPTRIHIQSGIKYFLKHPSRRTFSFS